MVIVREEVGSAGAFVKVRPWRSVEDVFDVGAVKVVIWTAC